MSNYTQTARHVFRISETTGKTPFKLIYETMGDYPQLEIKELAAVMTDGQVTQIVERFMASSNIYNARNQETACLEMSRRAALWAQAPTCNEKEERTCSAE